MATPQSEVYVDPWALYKGITTKLRRKYLPMQKKPNTLDAQRRLAQLALRLEDERNLPYAGLCRLASARVEAKAAQPAAEAAELAKAARFFAAAEAERVGLSLPGYGEDLASAIQCYGKAIRMHVEARQLPLAASLCLELGGRLYGLERAAESIEYFERASRYLEADPLSHLGALDALALALVDCGRFPEAVRVLDDLAALAAKIGAQADVLRNAEIGTALLLLQLDRPAHMSERQGRVFRIYTSDVTATSPAPPPDSRLDSEEDFLLLHSLFAAVAAHDADAADEAFSRLAPSLHSALLFGLGLDLVHKLHKGIYQLNE